MSSASSCSLGDGGGPAAETRTEPWLGCLLSRTELEAALLSYGPCCSGGGWSSLRGYFPGTAGCCVWYEAHGLSLFVRGSSWKGYASSFETGSRSYAAPIIGSTAAP